MCTASIGRCRYELQLRHESQERNVGPANAFRHVCSYIENERDITQSIGVEMGYVGAKGTQRYS